MSLSRLHSRIDKLLAIVEQQLNAIFRLPMRIIKINDAGHEQVIYETPYNPNFHSMAYKEYVNFDPDEDGIDP